MFIEENKSAIITVSDEELEVIERIKDSLGILYEDAASVKIIEGGETISSYTDSELLDCVKLLDDIFCNNLQIKLCK